MADANTPGFFYFCIPPRGWPKRELNAKRIVESQKAAEERMRQGKLAAELEQKRILEEDARIRKREAEEADIRIRAEAEEKKKNDKVRALVKNLKQNLSKILNNKQGHNVSVETCTCKCLHDRDYLPKLVEIYDSRAYRGYIDVEPVCFESYFGYSYESMKNFLDKYKDNPNGEICNEICQDIPLTAPAPKRSLKASR